MVYCLGVNDKDASPYVLAQATQRNPYVVPRSGCVLRHVTDSGSYHKATKLPALFVTLSKFALTNNTHAIIYCDQYHHGKMGSGWVFELEKTMGGWVVVKQHHQYEM